MRVGFWDDTNDLFVNDLKLTENYIEKGCMESSSAMKIYVKAASIAKMLLLESSSSHPILSVKKMIYSKEGILPSHQFLFYKGILLDEDNKTLAKYQVENKSLIHAVFCPAGFDPVVDDWIKMTIKRLCWEDIEIEVKPWYTAREIKAVLESLTFPGLEKLQLIHDGEILEDSVTMMDRNINKECAVYASWLPWLVEEYSPTYFFRNINKECFVYVSWLPWLVEEFSPTYPKNLSPEVEKFQILVHDCFWEAGFLVSESTTVFEIKKMIENFSALPPARQILFHGKKMAKLEDGKTLEFYKIKENPSLWLFSPSLKLSIKMPQVGTANPLQAYSFDSISDIKQTISEKMGIPCSGQTLIYAGKLLTDAETVEAYNIKKNSEVYAIFGLDDDSEELALTIVMHKKDIVDVKVKQWFTISDVKALVESKIEIPICVQDLYYNHGKLKDWKTVSDYGMKNSSNITLEICSSNVKLFIYPQNGREDNGIVIEAKNSDTVEAVLGMIPQEEIDIIGGRPSLFLDDTWLMEDKILARYGIKSGCILHLDRLVQINVTLPDGETMKADLKASYKIGTVKEKIEEICAIPYEVQSLTYLDDELDDCLTLRQYDALLGSLWALRWKCGGRSWSFFWPSYKGGVDDSEDKKGQEKAKVVE
ncbi:hypothetical protein L1049_004009 [Liquidambar formosana]|uniref:Ubiquitin-like domain-containing protein n=1 Tax=Liquidambar formosana TaxID=63359 RepID=A0AAP0RT50_LIQFO